MPSEPGVVSCEAANVGGAVSMAEAEILEEIIEVCGTNQVFSAWAPMP